MITAREIHSFGHLEKLHLLRSKYYERLGILRNALYELKLNHQYRDSLLTVQNESMVYKTQIRYERDKKAHEIAELNEQNERQINMQQTTSNHYIGHYHIADVHNTRNSGLRPAHKDPFTTGYTAHGRHATKFFHEHHARIPHTVNSYPRPGRTSDDSEQRLATRICRSSSDRATTSGTDQSTVGYSQIRSTITTPEWHTGDIIALLQLILENIRICSEQKLIEIEFAPTLSSPKMDFISDYM